MTSDLLRTCRRKLERLRQGGAPRVLDLFCGAGGLSLGFDRAGFEIVAGLDSDGEAAAVHALNFHGNADIHRRARNVTESPTVLVRDLACDTPAQLCDVLVGGPPCQAFARIGRAKLREVAGHPHAFVRDGRSELWRDWLAWVRTTQPLAVLVENVPDAMNFRGRNIADEMCGALDALGYACRYTLLNAASYGVPQLRCRLFVMGVLQCLTPGGDVAFPRPERAGPVPPGYAGQERVALRWVREPTLLGNGTRHWTPAPAGLHLPGFATVGDAIGDLPALELDADGWRVRGPATTTPGAHAARMRDWPGFETGPHLPDLHAAVRRPCARDRRLFAAMQCGDRYPQAHALAMQWWRQRLAEAPAAVDQARSEAWRRDLVPRSDPHKFPNRWQKLQPDRPAHTLTAHLGKDGYSHIHPDSEQARTLSLREAARLQSFPDGFQFGSQGMNASFRQLGNSVPPLLALALARTVARHLEQAAGR